MKIEFDNIVVNVNNELVQNKIKKLVLRLTGARSLKTKNLVAWTPKEVSLIEELLENDPGITPSQIAPYIPAHTKAAVYAYLHKKGLVGKKNKVEQVKEYSI